MNDRDPWKNRSNEMRCHTCMSFVPKMPKTPQAVQSIGRCRKHAPTMNGYPVVFRHDWCGDHKLDENAVVNQPSPAPTYAEYVAQMEEEKE